MSFFQFGCAIGRPKATGARQTAGDSLRWLQTIESAAACCSSVARSAFLQIRSKFSGLRLCARSSHRRRSLCARRLTAHRSSKSAALGYLRLSPSAAVQICFSCLPRPHTVLFTRTLVLYPATKMEDKIYCQTYSFETYQRVGIGLMLPDILWMVRSPCNVLRVVLLRHTANCLDSSQVISLCCTCLKALILLTKMDRT
ncbi:unnamed protein product [Cuscuta campestris]|uniref:Uncharacterized protein n=1 Tax=Cuscuta campestris TaxID=132261 RepID=A0A484N9X0_9ASTE|nr:unnamed protein product [Cuscuta campestris]